MTAKQEHWVKLLGLIALGLVIHKAAGKQAAALGVPAWAVTLLTGGLGLALG